MTGCRVLTIGGADAGPRLAGVTIGTTPEGVSVFRETRPEFDKTRSLTAAPPRAAPRPAGPPRDTSAPCPEHPSRPDGLTGLESSTFCQSAELKEASAERGERGEGVRRCARSSSSELRVDGDCARAGDVRDWENLDVDREPETCQKISRNATRAQHPPPRGGARLPIEAHAAFFSIVQLLLVHLAGRVHDKSEVRFPFRRCPKGGDPFLAFLVQTTSPKSTTRK